MRRPVRAGARAARAIVGLSKRATTRDFDPARAGHRACRSAGRRWSRSSPRARSRGPLLGRPIPACPAARAARDRASSDRRRQRLSPASPATSARSPPRSVSARAGEAWSRGWTPARRARGAWGGAGALYLTSGGFTAGRRDPGRRHAARGRPDQPDAGRPATSVPLETLVLIRRRRWCRLLRRLAGGRQHWTDRRQPPASRA